MNLSYWERNTWFNNIDFAIAGSGIVGLSCALELKRRFPKAKVVVFEKGRIPSGASTKNAGFACFGSVSEILEDLKSHSEQEVQNLVAERARGLELLRKNLGNKALDYKNFGGYEVFGKEDSTLFETCVSKIDYINSLLAPIFGHNDPKNSNNGVFSLKNDPFGFKNTQNTLIFNSKEGQLDTGAMMQALIQKAIKKGVFILNMAEITSFSAKNEQISVEINKNLEIKAKQLFIAVNGFAKQLLKLDVTPARAQVLVTHPIENLNLKGTFHMDHGYYYFRNIHNRVLIGGGRNLDIAGETTDQLDTTALIQNSLEEKLKTTILPSTPFEIAERWSGIMGVGKQKVPIITTVENRVHCGVRLGGMGVALGTAVGNRLANLI